MSLVSRFSELNLQGGNDPKSGSTPGTPNVSEKPSAWSSLRSPMAANQSKIKTLDINHPSKGHIITSMEQAKPAANAEEESHKNKLLGTITGEKLAAMEFGRKNEDGSDVTAAASGKSSGSSKGNGTLYTPPYNLEALLPLIRMEDGDLSMLSLGCDLATLGLDLTTQTPDQLISLRLSSPWSELSNKKPLNEPMFKLPSCYKQVNPPPALSKIYQFSDETLFYIFYTMPRDMLQEAAAQELTNRNWRFHKELRVWLTPVPGMEVLQRTPQFERGFYLFFDPVHWKRIKKDFLLMYSALEDRTPNNVSR
ncbi:CCR4-Not complex subunit Not2 [Schizosaccharomyces japonicus yFS275]|uniref:CCR4-Not complex subunit Not2 n=1 Tax=Schizosaccharomyces japonicus (strain yFS275 / FY16936) TaxID=402676 RepID=B6JXC6_SCHJY|nr:CCR4-Not complex subunit Not2 [Schizosaccharomyces japonicus yFS275]EEB06027.2 CCR4-Not complex subunit Not2 [Schizosaccharomyces japonicus yFS275]